MTQKAKQWLNRQGDKFTIKPKDGGIIGSLVGLGYVRQFTTEYRITNKGKRWIRTLSKGN